MTPLKDNKSTNSPDTNASMLSTSASGKPEGPGLVSRKPKTPLRKEELEKIASELKKKLSKASVAAKQLLSAASSTNVRNLQPDSPVSHSSLPKSSPLKNYYMWKRQIANGNPKTLSLLPNLYSPDRKLPTLTKPSIFLSSSPLKNITANGLQAENASRKSSVDSEAVTELNDSPTKRRRADSGAVIRPLEPHMVLQAVDVPLTPPKHNSLHPSPVLSSESQYKQQRSQTTPRIPRRQSQTQSHLLKTPTQSGRGEAYNDEEGADLLMYLATSPSVPKPYSNTPRAGNGLGGMMLGSKPNAAGNLFVAPAPPLTPKRHMTSTAKTPQNRLTPSVYGHLAAPGSALPSAGLALTPAGFNMNDYVNFFTPSPGQAANQQGSLIGKALLKTPDFHGQLNGSSRTAVDGKMINFDKMELYGTGNDLHKD